MPLMEMLKAVRSPMVSARLNPWSNSRRVSEKAPSDSPSGWVPLCYHHRFMLNLILYPVSNPFVFLHMTYVVPSTK